MSAITLMEDVAVTQAQDQSFFCYYELFGSTFLFGLSTLLPFFLLSFIFSPSLYEF